MPQLLKLAMKDARAPGSPSPGGLGRAPLTSCSAGAPQGVAIPRSPVYILGPGVAASSTAARSPAPPQRGLLFMVEEAAIRARAAAGSSRWPRCRSPWRVAWASRASTCLTARRRGDRPGAGMADASGRTIGGHARRRSTSRSRARPPVRPGDVPQLASDRPARPGEAPGAPSSTAQSPPTTWCSPESRGSRSAGRLRPPEPLEMVKPAHVLEQVAKVPMFECRDCGDCSLPEIAYLCPESHASRTSATVPAAARRRPVRDPGQALHLGQGLRPAQALRGGADHARPPPRRDNALRHQSAWANTFLGRDHGSRGVGEARRNPPVTTRQDGPSFYVIGENIHCSRVVKREGVRMARRPTAARGEGAHRGRRAAAARAGLDHRDQRLPARAA